MFFKKKKFPSNYEIRKGNEYSNNEASSNEILNLNYNFFEKTF